MPESQYYYLIKQALLVHKDNIAKDKFAEIMLSIAKAYRTEHPEERELKHCYLYDKYILNYLIAKHGFKRIGNNHIANSSHEGRIYVFDTKDSGNNAKPCIFKFLGFEE